MSDQTVTPPNPEGALTVAAPVRSKPTATAAFAVLVMAAALVLPFVHDKPEDLRLLSLGFIMGIGAMGLNVLTGYTGQISIGHAAFYGIGAYITANLIIEQNLTVLATLPIAIAVTAAFGALVGLPALRVKGPALALVTLGLAILVPTLLLKYGSNKGVALWKPKRRHLASPVDSLTDGQWKYLVPLVALIVVYVLTKSLVNSRAGRSLIAVRDQEVAAATAGVNVTGAKIASFAISAAYCGLAGSLSVLVRGQADASSALSYFQLSIYFLVAVVVGGAATVAGPILGGMLVQYLDDKAPEWSGNKVGMAPFILGAVLVAIVYLLPGGLLGGLRQLVARLRRPPSAPDPSPNHTPATSEVQP